MKKLLFCIALLLSWSVNAQSSDVRLEGTYGAWYFLTVPSAHSRDKDFLTEQGKLFCRDMETCYVLFWDVSDGAPQERMYSKKYADTILIMFSKSGLAGEQVDFNCQIFTDVVDKEKCL